MSWRGKRTIPFTCWVTHHPRSARVGPAAMRLTFASKVVCLPPYEMLQAPQAEKQQFCFVFFMGKWRAGGGRTSRQRWAGVTVVPFWLYFCFSLLFSFHKHRLNFLSVNRPSLTCDHLLIISAEHSTLLFKSPNYHAGRVPAASDTSYLSLPIVTNNFRFITTCYLPPLSQQPQSLE